MEVVIKAEPQWESAASDVKNAFSDNAQVLKSSVDPVNGCRTVDHSEVNSTIWMLSNTKNTLIIGIFAGVQQWFS